MRLRQHDLEKLVLQNTNSDRHLLQLRLDALDGSLDAYNWRRVTDVASSLVQLRFLGLKVLHSKSHCTMLLHSAEHSVADFSNGSCCY